ncbi:hypothetical protein LOK49_LG13G00917 [Camellia lanceoleosa]|uniref:Uncharacterized protein n=1 Tax=Camellia lanceoleosa TaxID=1840588 RepID=A0ACC0FJ75_9ERIC|nr:hypothetical protein LOK49_LG13G00917 [Camellia lanceoleosa]
MPLKGGFFQLKPYYTDAHGRLPPSPQEYPILGLNLLRLLVQNRIAEYHTELELLSASVMENNCIKHAVELEQSFMEGAYNRVLSARQTVPPETYIYFMDLLAKTVSSHIVHVPAGPNALSDVLISTPIFTGDGEGGSGFAAAAAAAAAGGVSGFDFAPEAENKTNDLQDDENALLQQALAMSMDDPAASVAMRDTDMTEAAADDQDLALALQLSVQDSTKDQASETDMSKLLADQSFVSSILASLPGVDPNDPSVKDLLASMQSQSESDQKKDEDKAPNEEDKK